MKKLHVSMRVEEFDSAVEFYSTLFGLDPVVERENYAKWDVDDPAVNFVIEGDRGKAGFDHIGVQVETQEELAEVADRMRQTGQPFLDIEKTTCCFANSDKAWVKGRAADRWEAFLTHSHDSEEYGQDRSHLLDDDCCAPQACCDGSEK